MPLITDLFNNQPFRAVELTNAMDLVEYTPTLLGALGEDLFRTVRSRSRMIAVYRRDGISRMVPVSPIGAPPVELEKAGANMRAFFTRRLAKGSTIYAEEMQGVLQMPEFEAVRGMQEEVAERGQLIRDDIELTEEHMRFGAVQGIVVDADGSTVLDNWFTNWGIAAPAAIDFNLEVATTNIRLLADSVREHMWTNSKGAWIDGRTEVHALAGSDFFTALVTHPTVEKTYLNYAAASELRGEIADTFPYGGIVWHRWRGQADTEFAIPDNEVRFFPVGARDVFQRVMAPAEFFPFINQPGRDIYALTIPDRDRNAWVRVELYNYPLYMCLRPEMLISGLT